MKRIIVLFLLFCSFAFARKVVVLSIPGITPEELYTGGYKNILFMAENGAVGLINCRVPKKYPSESAYLAMGMARRISGQEEARLCFREDEIYKGDKASEQFRRYWGFPPPLDSLLHIGFPSIAEVNQNLKGKTDYHLLGDLLAERGVKTILLGNGDILGEPHREASCVLIDSRGIIWRGDVTQKLLKQDPLFPGGLRTDFPLLKDVLIKYLNLDNVLILVETGDSLRIDLQYPYLNENRREGLIEEFLRKVDDLVGYILEYMRREDVLIILAPYPGRWALNEGKSLSPIIVMGNGMKGLLTSGTTKTLGVVSLYDFAPTIASLFGGPRRFFMGKVVYSRQVEKPIEKVLVIREQSWRSWSIHKIISAHIVALTLTFLLLGFALPLINNSFRFLILLPLLFLLSLLLLSPFSLAELPLVLFSSTLTIFLFALCFLFSSRCIFHIAITLLLILTFDLFVGGQIMASSGIGHSVEEGARYYGIGNEFMGLLAGCLLVLLYFGGNNHPQRFLWLFYAFLVGGPWWGANWGGFLTFITALVYLSVSSLRAKRSAYLYLLIVVLLLMGLPIMIDTLTRGTHIGLAFRNLLLGRGNILLEIIERKIITNVKLLRYSDWTVALGAECIFLFLYYLLRFYLPKQKVSLWLKTVSLCAVVAFIFNDSGVVASVFLLMPVIGVILMEEIPVELAKKWIEERRKTSF